MNRIPTWFFGQEHLKRIGQEKPGGPPDFRRKITLLLRLLLSTLTAVSKSPNKMSFSRSNRTVAVPTILFQVVVVEDMPCARRKARWASRLIAQRTKEQLEPKRFLWGFFAFWLEKSGYSQNLDTDHADSDSFQASNCTTARRLHAGVPQRFLSGCFEKIHVVR